MTPAGTSNEFDVQNGWEENTHTHTHIAVQQYIQYTMVCSHVGSNSVLFAESGDTTSLFANKEGSSLERRMEGGIADETSMPPLNCECFGSAAQGQPPSWVHTGLTASSLNVKCQTKHENRPSLYCSFSSHQKSASADNKSKLNKPSPSSPGPTS